MTIHDVTFQVEVYCTECGRTEELPMDVTQHQVNLLAKAKEISRNYNSYGWRVIDDGLVCDACIENHKDMTRTIDCKCGNWEEMPADMPRNKAQYFQIKAHDDDNGAVYECCCGENVVSKIIEREKE